MPSRRESPLVRSGKALVAGAGSSPGTPTRSRGVAASPSARRHTGGGGGGGGGASSIPATSSSPSSAGRRAANADGSKPRAPAAGASNPGACAACGKAFTDSYAQAMDRNWHPECLRCTACNKVLGSPEVGLVAHEDKPYCKADYLRLFAEKCPGCGEALVGKCVLLNKQKWHGKCVRCCKCERTVNASIGLCMKGAQMFCKDCYAAEFAPKCCLCMEPMMEFIHNPATGQRFCKKHKREPVCFTCHRVIALTTVPTPMGYVDFEDGRRVCAECSSTAVMDKPTANALLNDVRRFFAEHLRIVSMDDPVIKVIEAVLYDGPKMEKIARRGGAYHPSHPLGVTVFQIKTSVHVTTEVEDDESPAWFFGALAGSGGGGGGGGGGVEGLEALSAAATGSGPASGAGPSPVGSPRDRPSSAEAQMHAAAINASAGSLGAASAASASTSKLGLSTSSRARRGKSDVVRRETSVRCIGVVQGMPRVQLCAVLAHELCHVLMTLKNFPTDIGEAVVEGMCELWKHLYLTHLKSSGDASADFWLQRMTENLDPVYGDGFRAAQASLQAMPSDATHSAMQELLKHVRRHKAFPAAAAAEAASLSKEKNKAAKRKVVLRA